MMCYFFAFGMLGVIFPFTPLFLKHNGFSGTEIGIVLAMIPVNKFFLTRLWTKLFEQTQMKREFMVVSLALSSLSLLLVWQYPTSFVAALVSIFFYSLFRIGLLPVIDTLTMRHIPESRFSYGQIRLSGSIAFIIGAMFTGKMIDMVGLTHFVELAMISGILIVIPLWLLPYDSISVSKEEKTESVLGREFYIIVIAVMLYFISFTFNNQFLNIKIESAGLTQSIAGNMWSLGVLIEIIIMFFSGRFMKWQSSVFWLSSAMVAGTARVLLIGLTDHIGLLYLANSLHGIAFGLFHLSMMELINEQVAPENRLKAQSTYSAFAFGLGTIMGSVFSGITYDLFGVDTTFLIASIFSAAGLVVLFMRKRLC